MVDCRLREYPRSFPLTTSSVAHHAPPAFLWHSVQYAEFGYGDFGQYGGERIAWDLSHVDASVNVGQSVTDNKGQTVTCNSASCPADQSYNQPHDSAADRNSPLGTSFTITYCP